MNSACFYITSFLLVMFGILTLVFRNIFYSLLSAVCVFFLTAVIFLTLGSEYNAIIQFAVYGFAVPIIIGLGIMFTNFKNKNTSSHKNYTRKYIVMLTSGIFILASIYAVLISQVIIPNELTSELNLNMNISTLQNFELFSKGLFNKYVLGFEIISVILTITAAGLTLAQKRKA